MNEEILLQQARLLVQRLERLSADSLWAHRASGYRASLLKAIDRVEKDLPQGPARAEALKQLNAMINKGFELLEKAALELLKGRPVRRWQGDSPPP